MSFFEDSSAIPCPWNLLSLHAWPARMLAITFGVSEEKFCGGKERNTLFSRLVNLITLTLHGRCQYKFSDSYDTR